jgi:hypothetical protein
MDLDKFLNRKTNKPDVDSDIIRGRRLTNLESMYLLLPDLPSIDEKILKEVLKPYIKWE